MKESLSQVTFAKDKGNLKFLYHMLDICQQQKGKPIYNAETGKTGRVTDAFIKDGCVYLRRTYN